MFSSHHKYPYLYCVRTDTDYVPLQYLCDSTKLSIQVYQITHA